MDSNIILQCPECGRFSDSIKRYKMIDFCLFIFIAARLNYVSYTCCPLCMRRHILKKGFTYNIITANLLWFFLILPYSIILLLFCLSKGHSKSVLKDIENANK